MWRGSLPQARKPCHFLQRLANLAQHALTRGAQNLPLQHLAVFGLEERWELYQPGRGLRRQNLHDGPSLGTGTQSPQRLEGSLADAGFPGDEGELPLAPYGVLQPVVQISERPVAPDQPAVARPHRHGRAGRDAFTDRGNEPVAALGQGFNEHGILRTIPECTAYLADVSFDGLRFNDAAGPDRLEQRLLRHQLSGVLHQIQENGKRFGG